jgi:hypothetical protein
MTRPRLLLLLVFCLSVFVSACGSGPAKGNLSNQANRTPVDANKMQSKDDIEELEGLVKLTYHPEDAVWRDDADAQGGRKLVCVLRFKPEEAQRITEAAGKYRAAQPVELEAEGWFPPELVAKSQQSGNETIKGTSYSANDFLIPPFTEGRAVRIDGTNFFVVELSGKQ